jgi:hypothetical protein
MTFLHVKGYGMGFCYGSLAFGSLLGGRWTIPVLFYPLRRLTLKRNGDAFPTSFIDSNVSLR